MIALHLLILSKFDAEIIQTKKLVLELSPYENLERVREKLAKLTKRVNDECGRPLFVAETLECVNEYRAALQKPVRVTSREKCPVEEQKTVLEERYLAVANRLIVKKGWNDVDAVGVLRRNKCPNKCPTCENTDATQFETNEQGLKTCTVCFTEITTLEVATSNLDYSRATVTGKFIYNRVLHFHDCIKQFQGNQNCKIPQSVYDNLNAKFKAYRLLVDSPDKRVRYSKITKEHIKMFLDTPKQYENVTLIYTALTGKSGVNIGHLEMQLIEDFKELVTLYDSLHSRDRPEELDRKNFLNVQYVLFQLLRRHGYSCSPEDFSMLKTTERKLFHDQICSSLFKKLGWNFTKTF